MDLGLNNKGALVTGASSGLGFAVAMELAREGATVLINSRNKERLEEAAEKIRISTGASIHTIASDLSLSGVAEVIAERAEEVLPHGIEIFVSNTGGPPAGLFLDQSPERFRDAADALLHSAINLTREILPKMIEQKWGRMIYITSVAAIQPIDDLILSNVYRAGLMGFCKTIASTYGKYGITANAVCPGYTSTARVAELAQKRASNTGTTPDEVIAGFAKLIPTGRIGRPDELAAAVTFLASERAGFINGISLPVDGGTHKALI